MRLDRPPHKPALSREEETTFPSLPSLNGNLIISVQAGKMPAVLWSSLGTAFPRWAGCLLPLECLTLNHTKP